MNGHAANGHAPAPAPAPAMAAVFPEALSHLKAADPEVYSLIEQEKIRQWWASQPCFGPCP